MQKRALKDLINTADPAWPLVQNWITTARNSVEVLPADRERGEDVLLHLQVTTRSPMGAFALETGGILVDHGWLRFLGSGHERMQGNLRSWNVMGQIRKTDYLENALVIAHDVIGGFFAINGGAFSGKLGTVFYFAPDTLKWESTEKSYSQLLEWAMFGNLGVFYENMRWPGWENEVSTLNGDQGISIYPFVSLNKKIPISDRSRRAISMNELWNLHLDLSQQLGGLPFSIEPTNGIDRPQMPTI